MTTAAQEEYEVCGQQRLRCAMSQSGHRDEAPDDIDVYLALRKLDSDSKEVKYTGTQRMPNGVVLGWICASHCALDSTPYPNLPEGALPFLVLSHKRSERKEVRIF